MKPHENINAAGSVTTSPTRRPPQAELPTDDSKKLTESQFLKEQAANARAAFSNTLRDLGSALGQGVSGSVDPRRLTRKHPLIALPAAVVAGFAAAAAVVPSKGQQAEAHLARLAAALAPAMRDGRDGRDGKDGKAKKPVEAAEDKVAEKADHSKSWLSSMMSTLAVEAFHALKPVLMNVAFGGLAGASAATAAEEVASSSGADPSTVTDASADPAIQGDVAPSVVDISSPS